MSQFDVFRPDHVPPEVAEKIAEIPLPYFAATLAHSPELLEHLLNFFDLPMLIKALIVRAAGEGKIEAALRAFESIIGTEALIDLKRTQRTEDLEKYGWYFEGNTLNFLNEVVTLTPTQTQLFMALQGSICTALSAEKGYCYQIFSTEELEKIVTETDFISEGNYIENLVSHIRRKLRTSYVKMIHSPEADQIYFPWITTVIRVGFQLKLLSRSELIMAVQSFDAKAVPIRSIEPDYVATSFKYTDAVTGVGLNLAEQYLHYRSYKTVLLPEEVVIMKILFEKRGKLLPQNYILDELCRTLELGNIPKSTMSVWNTQLKRNLYSFALQMQQAGATEFLSLYSIHGRNGGLALTTTSDVSSLDAFMSPPPPPQRTVKKQIAEVL